MPKNFLILMLLIGKFFLEILETKSKKIPTAVYYPIPLNEHKPYNKYPVSKSGLDVSYYLSKNVLSLPMHPYLKEDEIIYISENINNFIKKH